MLRSQKTLTKNQEANYTVLLAIPVQKLVLAEILLDLDHAAEALCCGPVLYVAAVKLMPSLSAVAVFSSPAQAEPGARH